ncbi:MAG: hypothetical protein LKJ83_00445 [Eubacteriaceae bacterium]|nr:hypothetical protein [Eubacteriaceae bacterium]
MNNKIRQIAAAAIAAIFSFSSALVFPAGVCALTDMADAAPVAGNSSFGENKGVYSSWKSPGPYVIPREYAGNLAETASTQYVPSMQTTDEYGIGRKATVFRNSDLGFSQGITITNLKYFDAASGDFQLVDEKITLENSHRAAGNTRTDKLCLYAIEHTPDPVIHMWGAESVKVTVSYMKAGTSTPAALNTGLTLKGIAPKTGVMLTSLFKNTAVRNQIVSASSRLEYFRNSNAENVFYNPDEAAPADDADTSVQYLYNSASIYMILFDNSERKIDDSTAIWSGAAVFAGSPAAMAKSEPQRPTFRVSDADEMDVDANTYAADDTSLIYRTGEFVNGGFEQGVRCGDFRLNQALPSCLEVKQIKVLRDGSDVTVHFDIQNKDNNISAAAKKEYITGGDFCSRNGSRYVLTVTADLSREAAGSAFNTANTSIVFEASGSVTIDGRVYPAGSVRTSALMPRAAAGKPDSGNTGTGTNTGSGSSSGTNTGSGTASDAGGKVVPVPGVTVTDQSTDNGNSDVSGNGSGKDSGKAAGGSRGDGQAKRLDATVRELKHRIAAKTGAAGGSSPKTGDEMTDVQTALLLAVISLTSMGILAGGVKASRRSDK